MTNAPTVPEDVERALSGDLRQWSTAADHAAYELPLRERLRIRWYEDTGGGRKSWPRNPDGVEAAEAIAALSQPVAVEDEELVEKVARAIRGALVERWQDAVRSDEWEEDILLTGCQRASFRRYETSEEAAEKLAQDAARAALEASGITSLKERLAKVEGALRPFADCVDQIEPSEDDEEWAKFRLLIRDYRRARAALQGEQSNPAG